MSIKVNSGSLKIKAKEFNGKSEELSRMASKITQYVTSLRGDWDGEAAAEFEHLLNKFLAEFKKASGTLSDIGERLNKLAEAYEELEAKGKKAFQVK